jgi:hypothetical protein
MTRPHLSRGAFDNPEAELARLYALLEENTKKQLACGSADIVLIAESGTLMRWIGVLEDYRSQKERDQAAAKRRIMGPWGAWGGAV